MVESLKTQVIHTLQGDIEVLHATPDQILRFHDVQNIQNIHVLAGDSILPVIIFLKLRLASGSNFRFRWNISYKN